MSETAHCICTQPAVRFREITVSINPLTTQVFLEK